MKCEVCKKNAASVHLTDVSNNAKRELHLCEECAKGQGVTIKSYLNKEPNYPEILQNLAQMQGEGSATEKDLTCKQCGMSYRTFRSTGKFGCPEDYVVFKKLLVGLLEKIHGKAEHVGKVPSRTSTHVARQQELRSLRADLEKAVRGEAYEKAAQIRDRIYELEGRDG
jgi:protein arginine kinase activator